MDLAFQTRDSLNTSPTFEEYKRRGPAVPLDTDNTTAPGRKQDPTLDIIPSILEFEALRRLV